MKIASDNLVPEFYGRKASYIFVFGSNLAGWHGKGAALCAKRMFGAKNGVGMGPVGQSYAIPTKDETLRPLPLSVIAYYVRDFMEYVRANPDIEFKATKIGCGYAGYQPFQIASFFGKRLEIPPNLALPKEFWENLEV